ncbi:MAG: hypothetical protein MJY78_11225 [Fibrobacter sp.]|nr:hypothetical protein [Fibrobacter sp.]
MSQGKLAQMLHTTQSNVGNKLNSSSSLSIDWWLKAMDELDFEIVVKPKKGTVPSDADFEMRIGSPYDKAGARTLIENKPKDEPKQPRAPKGSVNAPRGYDFFGLKDD